MRPFNIDDARQGKPVCTRDGRDVRIVCWDMNGEFYSLLAVIENEDGTEYGCEFRKNGKMNPTDRESDLDLFMKSETKTGWVNIYRNSVSREYRAIWDSEVRAKNNIEKSGSYITTVPITWEE
jgi:hypothetical protein